MFQRATHVFIGVIEKEDFESWPFFRVRGDDGKYWGILRRRVRIETVLRGNKQRPSVDIYEIFWTGFCVWRKVSDRRGDPTSHSPFVTLGECSFAPCAAAI